MMDTVVLFEDEDKNGIFFLVKGGAFTDDLSPAQRFRESQKDPRYQSAYRRATL